MRKHERPNGSQSRGWASTRGLMCFRVGCACSRADETPCGDPGLARQCQLDSHPRLRRQPGAPGQLPFPHWTQNPARPAASRSTAHPRTDRQGLTNHVLAHVRHGVELLLADLTGELLLRVAVNDLVVLVKRPQLLESFATGHALRERKSAVAETGTTLGLWDGPAPPPEDCW